MLSVPRERFAARRDKNALCVDAPFAIHVPDFDQSMLRDAVRRRRKSWGSSREQWPDIRVRRQVVAAADDHGDSLVPLSRLLSPVRAIHSNLGGT